MIKVEYIPQSGVFKIDTEHMTYAFARAGSGYAVQLYWGGKIDDAAQLPSVSDIKRSVTFGPRAQDADHQEYAGWGDYCYAQSALKVRHADGCRDLLLKYKSHVIENGKGLSDLRVTLADPFYPVEVTLIYTVYDGLDIIDRSAVIANRGETPLILESAFSANLRLPYRDGYRLTYLTNGWCREYRINRQPLGEGKTVLEAKGGQSSSFMTPAFFADEENACEESGRVYFGALQWSGNWKMVFEKDEYGRTSITSGINDHDFSWTLGPGETFETPVMTAGFTSRGFGEASRILHRYQTAVLSPASSGRDAPVTFNIFGTLGLDISEEKILGVIDKLAYLGVEYLVIDDGWFGEGSDQGRGLGDWEINRALFPDGFRKIKEKLDGCGIKFGFWIEPESVNAKSRLYSEHPDWIYRYLNREPQIIHSRLSLDFSREDVMQYVLDKTSAIIREYGVKLLKVDYNRLISQPGSADTGKGRSAWVDHVRNLYRYFGALKSEFPDLLIENCAAGGFRNDFGVLKYADIFNHSDNQDPYDGVKMHEGFTYFFHTKFEGGGFDVSECTTHPNGRRAPIKYQAAVGMMGQLGIGQNLLVSSPEELSEIKNAVELFKNVRHITGSGELYRLASAYDKPYAAYEYYLRESGEGVVFILGTSPQFRYVPQPLRLCGLDADKIYEVEGVGRYAGSTLSEIGIRFTLRGDMDCRIIKFSLVKG